MSETTFDYGRVRVRDLRVIEAPRGRREGGASEGREGVAIDAGGAIEIVELGGESRVGHGGRGEGPWAAFDEGSGRGARGGRGVHPPRPKVQAIEVNGELVQPTRRFWGSFFQRFGVSDTVFKYFDHAEVFARVAERASNDEVRYCLERGKGQAKLLAVVSPDREVMRHDHALEVLSRYRPDEVRYREGVLTSTHAPRSGEEAFPIGADAFKNRFVLDTPIDGYSQPKIHLSLLRLICSNGAVGYSDVFRSELSMGRDVAYAVERALDSFDNVEGYAALRQRFDSAQRSWASLHECNGLYRLLARLPGEELGDRDAVVTAFQRTTGDLHGLYGLANLDALSAKRQRILPARCRVYDLINFASELATHQVGVTASRALQAYIGDLVSDEYDMEGTADRMVEFPDLLTTLGTGGDQRAN